MSTKLTQPHCEAVIFDMDGLMIDSEPFWQQAEMELFAKVGINLTVQDCIDTTGIRILDIVKLRYSQQPWDIAKLGITIEQLSDMIVSRVIELVKQKGEPLPGLKQCLQFFLNKKQTCPEYANLKFAVCSSSSMNLIEAVCQYRLNDVENGLNIFNANETFDVFMSAEKLQYGKPHPSVYLECCEKLGVNPLNCLALEDSLTGTLSAKSARMKVISVPVDFPDHSKGFGIADAVLGSLNEVNENLWVRLWNSNNNNNSNSHSSGHSNAEKQGNNQNRNVFISGKSNNKLLNNMLYLGIGFIGGLAASRVILPLLNKKSSNQ